MKQATLYDRLKQASVEVLVHRRLGGSGCIVGSDGVVLTAAHVLAHSKQNVEVLTPTGCRLPASLIAIDEGHDLALLQLPRQSGGYPALALAKEMPAAGERIHLFGAPLFRHAVMLQGSVARNGTTFEYVEGHYIEVVHVCGATAKGVSGGPWVNARGEVVAVQSSMMSLGNAVQGIAFVAPIDAIRHLLATKQSPAVTTLGTGVEELWEQPPEFLKAVDRNAEGLVLRQVKKQGPAAKSRIGEGEIITAIDGKPVHLRDELLRAVRNKKVGEKVTLTVLNAHGENQRQVEVRLDRIDR